MDNRKPYRLPDPILCDPAEIASGITMDIVRKYIDKHETRTRRYRYLENLYKGFHDIYRQPEKEAWKPDWRLAVNFPRYLTMTFSGYGYGKGIKVYHDDEKIMEDIKTFEKSNDILAHNSKMVRYAAIYGHAFEYYYQDEQARTCITAEKPSDLFVVYDDTMKKRALFAVRYGRHTTGNYEGQIYGEVMMNDMNIPFDRDRLEEPYDNPYAPRIGVVEWMLNDDRMGLFEGIAPIVEAYNSAFSNNSNDISYFADQILKVIGFEIDTDTMEHMRDKRVLNLYGDDPEDLKNAIVDYLQKGSDGGQSKDFLDRAEKLIYQISMVANISDDTFGNSTSGIALAYKLWSTSNVVNDFNTLINKSIQKRMKIWSSLSTNTSNPEMWREIQVQFSQNVPRNYLEETQTAAQASGIVSQETQLKLLSYVDDPKAEIERIKQEEENDILQTADRSLFLSGGGD